MYEYPITTRPIPTASFHGKARLGARLGRFVRLPEADGLPGRSVAFLDIAKPDTLGTGPLTADKTRHREQRPCSKDEDVADGYPSWRGVFSALKELLCTR